jgi:hypothetical protein
MTNPKESREYHALMGCSDTTWKSVNEVHTSYHSGSRCPFRPKVLKGQVGEGVDQRFHFVGMTEVYFRVEVFE